MAKPTQILPVVGGVDTHQDLHVAAVVDQSDRALRRVFQSCYCHFVSHYLPKAMAYETVNLIQPPLKPLSADTKTLSGHLK